MWALLSTRLRSWLLLAVALPLVRVVLGRLADRAQARRPGAAGTRLLTRAQLTVDRFAGRRRR